jgi:hypothetical protein
VHDRVSAGVDVNRRLHSWRNRKLAFFITKMGLVRFGDDAKVGVAVLIGAGVGSDTDNSAVEPSLAHEIVGGDLDHGALSFFNVAPIRRA